MTCNHDNRGGDYCRYCGKRFWTWWQVVKDLVRSLWDGGPMDP